MPLSEGDPRVAAPDLYARLTGVEQRLAERAFADRLAFAGLNDPQYPDDEPACLVAAEAIRSAAARFAARWIIATWGAFAVLIVAASIWPGLKGTFMRAALAAAVAMTAAAILWRMWRRRQAAQFLRDDPRAMLGQTTRVSSSAAPAPVGRLGPRELAPVLVNRITRFEAQLVIGFFPGEGQVPTGRPRWDGRKSDRVRLRRCFYAAMWFMVVVVGVLGSALLDIFGSALASGFADDSAPSGLFLVGWAATLVWAVRRRSQIRRWYAAGVGREAELAARATPVSEPPEWVSVSPTLRWVNLVIPALAGVLFIGFGTWGIVTELGQRSETHPFAGGVTTTGTVIEVKRPDPGASTARAVSEFTDAEGRTHRVTGQSGEEEFAVGDSIQVSYLPEDPDQARDLTTNDESWRFPLGAAIFGVVAGILTVVMAFFAIRRQLRREPEGGT